MRSTPTDLASCPAPAGTCLEAACNVVANAPQCDAASLTTAPPSCSADGIPDDLCACTDATQRADLRAIDCTDAGNVGVTCIVQGSDINTEGVWQIIGECVDELCKNTIVDTDGDDVLGTALPDFIIGTDADSQTLYGYDGDDTFGKAMAV